MGELEWRRPAAWRHEADGPNGAQFWVTEIVSNYTATMRLGNFIVQPREGFDLEGAKAWCQRLADWASGTKREGANRG